MKTSKAEFVRFQKAFLFWANKLECPHRIYFLHIELSHDFAHIQVDEEGKVATVRFALDLSKQDRLIGPTPEETGKHEALHLLFHRLFWLGTLRHISSDLLGEEWERLVRVLEKVLT